MTRHVVFGTGQIGHLVVEQLVQRGIDVVAVNRSGDGVLPGATVVGGDATDPDFTTRVAAGADVVYFCLNALRLRPLGRGVPAPAARRARRAPAPPAPGWSCSTTSTPTAHRTARTWSRRSRRDRPRPRPRPGPR